MYFYTVNSLNFTLLELKRYTDQTMGYFKEVGTVELQKSKICFSIILVDFFGFLEKIIRQNIKLSIELYRIHLNWVHIFLMRDKYIFNSVVYTFILFNFLLLFKVFQYYVFAFSVHYEIFIWNLHRIYIHIVQIS